jgi:hypothetical protein
LGVDAGGVLALALAESVFLEGFPAESLFFPAESPFLANFSAFHSGRDLCTSLVLPTLLELLLPFFAFVPVCSIFCSFSNH